MLDSSKKVEAEAGSCIIRTDALRNARRGAQKTKMMMIDDDREHGGGSPTTVPQEILESLSVDNLTKHVHMYIMGV